MKTHKRPKTSRLRGSKTAGWGFRQKHKGHGNKGGFGMAGTGKRGDHKKVPVKKGDKKNRYFGKQGITSKGTERKRVNTMNLSMIKENLFTKDNVKIELKKYKILGVGEGFKAEITAMSASKTAIAKMEKAGGKIILAGEKKSVKQYVVKEKKAEEAKE
ncbi:hypothetical protein HN604_02925 [archaeon]|jgi:large subunit ribosomal protein L15|nr:hypothetical protein [archaeon]MBT6182790.1 hypothetical protein [archaeon]MBT6606120.1 hypothetical protein [archaeon]MBT7252040.1 hypothetical protein [archaeon]MBT7661011.1 hypothetical protein [archaeon]